MPKNFILFDALIDFFLNFILLVLEIELIELCIFNFLVVKYYKHMPKYIPIRLFLWP